MGLDGIWWAISSTSIVKGIIFTCTFYGSQENDGKLSKTMCVIQNSRKKRLVEWIFQAIREYYMKKCTFPNDKLHHPELAGKPMAVGGDPEARHGIVLRRIILQSEPE